MNPRHRPSSKRVLSFPCLIGTVVALAVLCPAAYFWHAYQATRTAEAFLLRADHYDQAGRPEQAATYLHRYLKLHPDNTDVRVHSPKPMTVRPPRRSGNSGRLNSTSKPLVWRRTT